MNSSEVLLVGVRAVGEIAADTAESKTGDIGPGLLAFLVVAALCVATFLLIRSMLVHVKRVPPTFEEPAGDADEERPPSVP